ncbi:microtubule-associated protein TORTIFOLIA1-like isoform X2 [Papaver somniferum]|uniref:microtubule-associated protein TORTIFOLIA1-like isoform X2 n=1 Tax=Papaver somniferum TaxID=3469 RepID=UPI000E6FF9DD|nr:microtubule-associated protein TORTIFOLIA1-like isoform X2 [Papaver somniferum]
MISQTPKTSKSTRPSPESPPPPLTKTPTSSSTSSRSSFSLSSHLAMVDLKQKILTSISKLSDRDTHQIAIEDLEKIIQTLTSDGVSVFLNCLYDSTNDPKPTVKKESLRLLGSLCTSHTDFTSTHLTKIISFIVKRLKDSDSSVRDSCRDTIGTLSCLYLNGDNANVGSVLSLFVKPLFEAMGEQNKVVQAASALAMARMVESSVDMPVTVLQKLCPRISKFLNNQNFLAKAALFSVVSSLSQVKAIAPQNFSSLLQSMHDCLESSEWSTRKAAADTLISLASHSSHLIKDGDGTALIINKLEACRFDKVKPVRDSMTETLHLLKKISEKNADGIPDDPNPTPEDGKSLESAQTKILDHKNLNPDEKSSTAANDASIISSPPADSLLNEKDNSISDKTVGAMKKKPHTFSDKELNPEFFQKFETNSGDLPEVVLPHRSHSSAISQSEDESEPTDTDHFCRLNHNGKRRDKWVVQRSIRGKDANMRAYDVDNSAEASCREDSCSAGIGLPRNESQVESSNSKVNWLAIQRQLSQMERQQAHLMNMLQDFMGGSHDGMITLENRVRGLERVVEDMARDLAISSGRRTNNCFTGYEVSSSRTLGKYRVHPFPERYSSSDGIGSGFRGRDTHWRSDVSDTWDSYPYNSSRNGHLSSRRALGGRSPVRENDGDQVGSRRGWDKGPGSTRLGEGPSARSVWQASKDEATLEAIRVAGEENGSSRPIARVEKELIGEAVGDENAGQDRGSIWASWSNAMDALQAGDVDLAYGEVLSTADDLLLVKLMDRTGPALGHLSDETANELLHATAQFLLEQNLFDIGFSWIQQLVDLVNENGCEIFNISMESKRQVLSNLQEASTTIEPPHNWEGPSPDQLMSQLGSAWGIELQQFQK